MYFSFKFSVPPFSIDHSSSTVWELHFILYWHNTSSFPNLETVQSVISQVSIYTHVYMGVLWTLCVHNTSVISYFSYHNFLPQTYFYRIAFFFPPNWFKIWKVSLFPLFHANWFWSLLTAIRYFSFKAWQSLSLLTCTLFLHPTLLSAITFFDLCQATVFIFSHSWFALVLSTC